MDGLADKARSEGVEIRTGVTVTGMTVERGAVTAVETDQGSIACEQLVVAVGPWIRDLWRMLELPERIDVHAPNGGVRADQPMWTYWALQEGTLRVDPGLLVDDEDQPPPVVHVDSDAPLHDDTDGSLITDQLWGIYYKPDPYFGGVQGGAVPQVVPRPAGEVAVDPYGPDSPDFVVGGEFRRIWSSALAHCHKRLQGQGHLMSPEPSGGIGCFTPDSFPIFDALRENAYVIADSNHGYKMIGVGALVAGELLGDRSDLLEPFRLSRYSTGALHPTSTSPFPWS
jgi:glycine/D-amino acid oxidase-like deaminating enzyme